MNSFAHAFAIACIASAIPAAICLAAYLMGGF